MSGDQPSDCARQVTSTGSNRMGDAGGAAVFARNLSSSTAAGCADRPMSTVVARRGEGGNGIAAGREDVDFCGQVARNNDVFNSKVQSALTSRSR